MADPKTETAPSAEGVCDRLMGYLTARDAEGARKIIKDDSNKEALNAGIWELVRKLSDLLTDEMDNDHPEVLDVCVEALLHLVAIGNPKELLLVFLEQMDTFNSDLKFKSLLPPLQKCIQNLPGKKGHSLAIALETIHGLVESLPLPQDQNLEGEERMLLDCDPEVQRINGIVSALITFITPFAEEVSWQNKDSQTVRQNSVKQIQELTEHIVKLLDKPMSVMDLSYDPSHSKGALVKSSSRASAEKLVQLLSCLQADFFKAISVILAENEKIAEEQKQREKKKEDTAVNSANNTEELDDLNVDHPLPVMGLGVLAYLVFGEKLGWESVPQIYVSQHFLEFNCKFISAMLHKQHSLVVSKGLKLFHTVLERIDTASLPATLLDWSDMKDALEGLLMVVTTCPVKDVCQYGVKILSLILQKFDTAGRHKAFYMLLSVTPHAGLAGYATQLLKNEIDSTLKKEKPDVNFVGIRLHRLLKLVFALPGGAETDLLDQSERIMAALNLLRYLILRDKPTENRTGIWDMIPELQKNYCQLLRTGIGMSKAHYNLEIEQVKSSRKKKKVPSEDGQPDISFTVGRHEMAGLDQIQQLQVLATAMHTFDMMESVLGRVGEVIDQQQKGVVTK